MKKWIVLLALGALVVGGVFSSAQPGYQDGTYTAASDADPRGYATATVEIKDGVMVDVQLVEYDGLAVAKDWDTYRYTLAGEANAQLAKDFVAANSAEVDIFSGATSSTKKYMDAVSKALAMAAGNQENQYFDGTYMGRSAPGARGYYEVVWVTVENDQITNVEFERILEDNQPLDLADYSYPLANMREQFKEAVIAANSSQIDTITGATGSTPMWSEAVDHALEFATTK